MGPIAATKAAEKSKDEAATVAKVAKENLKHTEKKEAKAEAEVAKAITSGDPKQAENAKKKSHQLIRLRRLLQPKKRSLRRLLLQPLRQEEQHQQHHQLSFMCTLMEKVVARKAKKLAEK